MKGGEQIGKLLEGTLKSFNYENPAASVPQLMKAYSMIQKLEDDYWKKVKSAEIKKIIPKFSITYKPDFRQEIADSWPQTIDDSKARSDWNWSHQYGLSEMTKDIIKNLQAQKNQELEAV